MNYQIDPILNYKCKLSAVEINLLKLHVKYNDAQENIIIIVFEFELGEILTLFIQIVYLIRLDPSRGNL